MDFNGDFPGSRVKRLKVDTTADIAGDTTIGGDLHVGGTIDFKDVKADRVLTADGKVFQPAHSFQSDEKTGMWRDSNGDLNFSRDGLQVASFRSGQQAYFSDIHTISTEVADGGIHLTGIPQGVILSDSDLLINSLSTTTKFQNEGFPTLDLSPTEAHVYMPVRSDGKVTGEFYDFEGDPDNSKLYFDDTDTSVKMQVHGDPSCKFRSKGIEAIEGVFDAITASSYTTTTVSTTDLNASGTATVAYFSALGQALVRYNASGSQSISGGGTFQALTNWNLTPYIATGNVSWRPTYTAVGGLFTCTQTGYYAVNYVVPWAIGAGVRIAAITPSTFLTTGSYGYDSRLNSTVAGYPIVNTNSAFFKWNAGESLVLSVAQSTGAAVNVIDFATTAAFQYITIERLF